MIFVTVGTCVPFNRLINKIESIANTIDEPISVQFGSSNEPKHCDAFSFSPELISYFQRARLIITHAGMGTALEIMKMEKPFIMIPRLVEYNEHFDNHQVETCEKMNEKFGIKYIINLNELTPELIKNYDYISNFNNNNLLRFRKNILEPFKN